MARLMLYVRGMSTNAQSIIRKLSKVASLAVRPGTEGEGEASQATLLHLCSRLGREAGYGVEVQVALDDALRGLEAGLYGRANEAYYQG